MAKNSDKYTKEKAAEICDLLSEARSLSSICKQKDMPCRRTVYYWLHTYPEFMTMYITARQEAADFIVDQILEICSTEKDVQRARLMVDSRKWMAGRLNGRLYGDKLSMQHSTESANKGLDSLNLEELNAIIAEE